MEAGSGRAAGALRAVVGVLAEDPTDTEGTSSVLGQSLAGLALDLPGELQGSSAPFAWIEVGPAGKRDEGELFESGVVVLAGALAAASRLVSLGAAEPPAPERCALEKRLRAAGSGPIGGLADCPWLEVSQ
jgi:hypothetical protein